MMDGMKRRIQTPNLNMLIITPSDVIRGRRRLWLKLNYIWVFDDMADN